MYLNIYLIFNPIYLFEKYLKKYIEAIKDIPVPNAAPYIPIIGMKIELNSTLVKKIKSIKILCNLGISDIEKIL